MKLSILLFLAVFISGCSYSGKSERDGQIVKIAKEGYFHKTTEVEIIKGSLQNGGGAFGSRFDFTISDPALIEVANSAFQASKEIIVTYHSDAICPYSSSTSDCNFADNIVEKPR